ncbi:MAG TPA: cytochrome P450 [Nitrososphaeraceae archaeon]|nr:cytochrome P450 [Nitrososphaeraceae archaeon]
MQRKIEYPSGPSSIFPAKILRKFIRDPLNTFTNIAKEYGDISHFKLARQHVYLLNNPDYIEKILIYDHHNFKKGKRLETAKRLLGEGLVTSEGEYHDNQKKMIHPFFLPKKISSYCSIMSQYAFERCRNWQDGSVIDIHKEMMNLTFAIICKCMLNYDMDTKEAEKFSKAFSISKEYSKRLQHPIGHVLDSIPILPKVAQSRNAAKTLDSIVYKLISDRKKEIIQDISDTNSNNNKSTNNSDDLLSKLLLIQQSSIQTISTLGKDQAISNNKNNNNSSSTSNDGNRNDISSQLPDKQIRDHLITMLIAGHETTANALTWTFYLLSQNPHIEKKVIQEIDSIIENNQKDKDKKINDNNNTISIKDLPKLKYVEQVFREAMRLYPPVWSIGRIVKEDYNLGEYTIPKDSAIFMSQYVMHRDPRFYKDPEHFNPERWTNDFKMHLPRFAYFPFGGGLRGCIGEPFAWQEGIILIATILNYWTLQLVPKQNIKLETGITLNPKRGIKMKLKSRRAKN